MRISSPLLLTLVVCLSACGDRAVNLGPSGGTVESGKAKAEFPPGALVREQKVKLAEASDTKAVTYTSAGPAFTLNTEQAAFARPVTVTLPIEVSRLPPDVTPDRISVMLAQDGFGERLADVRVDLAAGTVTVTLERAVPLIHTQGAPAAAGAPPVLQAAIGPVMGVVLNTERAIYQARGGVVGARELAEEARALMKLVLNQYRDVNVPQPGKLVIEFMNEDTGALAFTTSANIPYIGVSVPYWGQTNQQGRIAALAHEYFHVLQHMLVAQNLRKTGTLVRPEIMATGSERWLYEATATWMETHLIPGAATHNVPRLTRDFGYQPLNHYEEVTKESVAAKTNFHQYAAFSFFSYLDTLYVGRNIVTRFWSEYLSGSWTRSTIADDAQRGAGSFGQLDHLDHILQTTPDNTGRKRNLREAYANFLLHYYYYKDFDPVSCNGLEKELGKPRDLALPNRLVAWSLPEGDIRQKTMTVAGGPFAIVKTFDIKQKLDPKAKDKFDLEVSLGLAERADPKESLLIVFPYKQKVQAPLVGNAKNRVQLKDWQDYAGAVVWVVDLSVHGGWDLIMTAEVKKPKEEKEPPPAAAAGMPPLVLNVSDHMHDLTDKSYFRPIFNIAVPAALQSSSSDADSARKQMGQWFKTVDKELGSGRKWAHLTVTIGDRTSHQYCDLSVLLEAEIPSVPDCRQQISLPRALGDYQAVARTSIMGKELTTTFPVSVRISPYIERDLREDIANFAWRLDYHERQMPHDVPDLYRGLGTAFHRAHQDQHALGEWNKAASLATDPLDISGIHSSIANHAFLVGDIETYVSRIRASGSEPDPLELAKLMLRERNDCAGARALLQNSAKSALDKNQIEDVLRCPKDGDTVLK